ncbi:hypothetical protein [Mesorhizobium sp. WSM3860]|uniref:hypothetical protein n=1 Tax=Mesorhizobium sp. WSM3860 TaxID=2029403 RepID=UPI000BAF981B|nr:hypothetical protein [Mesorhizobium sp. WSM3860]PBC04282.1 hypothetical protein CK220_11760 [Mesorhizobium sp. WSM3860]
MYRVLFCAIATLIANQAFANDIIRLKTEWERCVDEAIFNFATTSTEAADIIVRAGYGSCYGRAVNYAHDFVKTMKEIDEPVGNPRSVWLDTEEESMNLFISKVLKYRAEVAK